MKEAPVSATVLRKHLDLEITLYQYYLELLDEERGSVTKFSAEKVEKYTEKRQQLIQEIQGALLKRVQFVKALSGSEKVRLTDAIRNSFSISEAKGLLNQAEKIRDLTQKIKSSSREFNQVVNFGLNVVNGTLSIFMSATQNVNKAYTRKGVVRESFNPQGSRKSGIIKEA